MRGGRAGRRVVVAIALVAAGVSASAAGRPFESGIDTAAVRSAIARGRSPGSVSSQRFHDRYVVRLGDTLLDRLEVITEFRRVVLLTEQRARLADIRWGPEEAAAALRPWRNTVSLVLHVTFPPNNTYRAMPRFDIVLYSRPSPGLGPSQATRIDPIDLVETPRYVSAQPAPPGTPILAGLVEATFAARAVDRGGACVAGIFLEDRELRRVDLDFGRME